MIVNIIDSRRKIVAACDKELLGKIFEEGKFQLNVKENFYGGKEVSSEELGKIFSDMKKEDATFNLAGGKVIEVALETGVMEEKNVGEVDGIKFGLKLL